MIVGSIALWLFAVVAFFVFYWWHHRDEDEEVFEVVDEIDFKYHKVPRCEAVKDKIIECSICSRPACQIDQCWPYCNDYTLCKEHKDHRPNSTKDRDTKIHEGFIWLLANRNKKPEGCYS